MYIFTFIYNNLSIYILVLKAAVSKILSHVDCVCVCQKAEAQVATAIRSMKCVATVCRNGLWIMWSTRPLRTDLQIAWSGGISQDETTVESEAETSRKKTEKTWHSEQERLEKKAKKGILGKL